MKTYRAVLTVEVFVDSESRDEVLPKLLPLMSKISSTTEGELEVNDCDLVTVEPDDELDDFDDSEPCGDPDCACC